MCFSSEASFAGGVVLSTIGIITLTKVHKSSQILFACIPLFFGMQQFTEGFLWLALRNHSFLDFQKVSTYLFLIMADVVWPIMIPLSVLFMERKGKRKNILIILLYLGFSLSIYYASCLLFLHVEPQIVGYHIQYNTNFPKSMQLFSFCIYLIVTIIPLFVSSIKRTHLLGILMALSCAVTVIFFTQFLISVWCFFAALISAVIFWILRDSKHKFKLDKIDLSN